MQAKNGKMAIYKLIYHISQVQYLKKPFARILDSLYVGELEKFRKNEVPKYHREQVIL